MGVPRGIRWPEDLVKEIELAQKEDLRKDFSDEVFYLVRLGLDEAAWQRDIVKKAKQRRSHNRESVEDDSRESEKAG